MPTATFTVFDSYLEYEAEKIINLESDSFKVMLTNTAPVSTNSVKANITEISAGNGYSAGGAALTISSSSQTSGTYKWVLADNTITASGGTIGPFRYAVVYDDTPTSPADPLVGYADYGSSITLQDTQRFVLDCDASAGVLQKIHTP